MVSPAEAFCPAPQLGSLPLVFPLGSLAVCAANEAMLQDVAKKVDANSALQLGG